MIVSLNNNMHLDHMGHSNNPLCKSESGCSKNDVITSMLSYIVDTHSHVNQTIRFRVTDQTESAIIYVAVVVVFYAAIIILLLGTSRRRPFRSRPSTKSGGDVQEQQPKQPTVAVYIRDDNRTEVQVQNNLENEEQTLSNDPAFVDTI